MSENRREFGPDLRSVVVHRLRLAPDGKPRPDAPFGRGPFAAHVLARVIDASVWAGSRCPPRVADSVAVVGGHLEWALRPAKRRRLAANLGHALGRDPDDKVVRRCVRREIVNEAHRSAELLWALGRPDELLASTEFDGLERAQKTIVAGNGMLLAGAHIGGWELATALPDRVFDGRTSALVADDWLAWAIAHMRTRVGLEVIYRTEPVSRLGARLRAGETIIVLGDDASGRRPRLAAVEFLDGVAELPTGVATLSRLYQAPIVGFCVVRVGTRRWRVIVDEPIEPPPLEARDRDRETLQALADRWSELIRAYPDQWASVYRIGWIGAGPTAPA